MTDRTTLPDLLSCPARTIADRLACFWHGYIGESVPELIRPLTGAERAELIERRNALAAALMPLGAAYNERVAAAVSGMLGAFPAMQRHGAEAASSMVTGYLWTVRGYPPWAIEQACELVRSGQAGLDPAYCPSEPEFAELVRNLTQPYRASLERVDALLAAPVRQSPERKPSREEIEAILGRKIDWERDGDGQHARRVMQDLEERRKRRAEHDQAETAS